MNEVSCKTNHLSIGIKPADVGIVSCAYWDLSLAVLLFLNGIMTVSLFVIEMTKFLYSSGRKTLFTPCQYEHSYKNKATTTDKRYCQ